MAATSLSDTYKSRRRRGRRRRRRNISRRCLTSGGSSYLPSVASIFIARVISEGIYGGGCKLARCPPRDLLRRCTSASHGLKTTTTLVIFTTSAHTIRRLIFADARRGHGATSPGRSSVTDGLVQYVLDGHSSTHAV